LDHTDDVSHGHTYTPLDFCSTYVLRD
jgi:hypothetical protein